MLNFISHLNKNYMHIKAYFILDEALNEENDLPVPLHGLAGSWYSRRVGIGTLSFSGRQVRSF
jgi:hypothetical protein